jgi:hypothetical protein
MENYKDIDPDSKFYDDHIIRKANGLGGTLQRREIDTSLSPEQLNKAGVLSQRTKGYVPRRVFGKFSGLPGDVGSVKAVGSERKAGIREQLKSMILESLGIPEGLSGGVDFSDKGAYEGANIEYNTKF